MDELNDLDDLDDLDGDPQLGAAYSEFGYEDEDPEIAYNLGLFAEPDDRCPYRTQEAIDEWGRGKADADRRDIYSMRDGDPPDHYRDPD